MSGDTQIDDLLDVDVGPGDTFNYFNYFTEVEEEFVKRRGKFLRISPLEWSLVESWKDTGIPLHIVLRGINQAFDNFDARPVKYRRVNSIFFCQQEVESAYAEYSLSQVGADPRPQSETPSPPEGEGGFSRESIVAFIARAEDELKAASDGDRPAEVREMLTRACSRLEEISRALEAALHVNPEALERDLDAVDGLLLENLRSSRGTDGISRLRKEAESALKGYKKTMAPDFFEKTVENLISRRLREEYGIPRLSLFYL